jgi:hypothetical protein
MPVLDDHAAESDRIAVGAIVLALTVAALFHLQSGVLTALGLAAMVAWLIWWLNIAALHEAGEVGLGRASWPSSGADAELLEYVTTARRAGL